MIFSLSFCDDKNFIEFPIAFNSGQNNAQCTQRAVHLTVSQKNSLSPARSLCRLFPDDDNINTTQKIDVRYEQKCVHPFPVVPYNEIAKNTQIHTNIHKYSKRMLDRIENRKNCAHRKIRAVEKAEQTTQWKCAISFYFLDGNRKWKYFNSQ